jgi:hypothetical protein
MSLRLQVGQELVVGAIGLPPIGKIVSETIMQTKLNHPADPFLPGDFANSCLAGSFWGRTKVDLYFLYLISFDSEEFRIPGAAAILGFAVVEDEGFVAFFKQLLNAIGRGFLAIGPAPFEISFTVNAIVVRTGKYEVVAQ